MRAWRKRDYLSNSPQFVKQKIFVKYGISCAIWIETGTFLGSTTSFLADRYPHVHSIEPGKELYNKARKIFKNQNITLHNDTSETILPTLLPSLQADINIWLDGHYSSGITFEGEKHCPVEDELASIKNNMSNFDAITILIADVRCFLTDAPVEYKDYPSLDYLVDWSRQHNVTWRIEHDIFIMQKQS